MNFTFKDILIIVLLLAVIAIIVMHMKASNKLLTAVAVKTGAVELADKTEVKSRALKTGKESEVDDGGEQDFSKPVKLKTHQKQLLTLFEDKVPKTTTELKQLFKKHYKEMDSTKLNNMVWNLKKIGVLYVEKDSEGVNYWGPDEWFDDDGMLMEEYAEKIPTLKIEEDEEKE